MYIPNIIAGAGQIADTASRMTANGGSFGTALYSAFIYGTFQLANVAVFVQHAKSFEKPDDAVQSMGIGWIINALMMIMVVLGIMTVCTKPDERGERPDTFYGAVRCWKRIYDAADFCFDHSWSGIYGG